MWNEQVTFVISGTTTGNITSRFCASSTPTLSLKGLCPRLKCLVACYSSEIRMDYRDANEEGGETYEKNWN